MVFSRRRSFKKSSFKRSWYKRRPIRKPAVFTSNKGTLVQLVTTFTLPVQNTYFGAVVFPSHAPGVFYDARDNPNALAYTLAYVPFTSINNALSVYQNIYISSLQISVTVPSALPFTYQFVRNNIPLALDPDGENLLSAQVSLFANNVVDKSRLTVSSYGGTRGITYKAKNKYDAVWLLKYSSNQANAGTPLNSTIGNLLSQQQVIFMANNSPVNPGAGITANGLISFRVLYKCIVIGNNSVAQLPADPQYQA